MNQEPTEEINLEYCRGIWSAEDLTSKPNSFVIQVD